MINTLENKFHSGFTLDAKAIEGEDRFFKVAAMLGTKSARFPDIEREQSNGVMEESLTDQILRGICVAGVQPAGYDFHGLSPQKARGAVALLNVPNEIVQGFIQERADSTQ